MRLRQVAQNHLVDRRSPGAEKTPCVVRPRAELPLASVVNKGSRVITVRRSTVVQAGIVALIALAFGVGIVVELTIGSTSSPPTTKSIAIGASTTTEHVSTTTSTTDVAPQPAVLSCGPGSALHVRPTSLTVGCSTGDVTVTSITWDEWGAATGGQGTGILDVDSINAPAIVVVFHDVNGVFQDVSITPTKEVSTTATTAPRTRRTTAPTTTTTTGGLSPIAATQPGSGWGGD